METRNQSVQQMKRQQTGFCLSVLCGDAGEDVVDRDGVAAAGVPAPGGLDVLVIGVAQIREGLRRILVRIRVVFRNFALIVLPDPRKGFIVGIHIGQKVQEAGTEEIVITDQLVQVLFPLGRGAVGDPEGFDGGPQFPLVVVEQEIQFADAFFAAAASPLGLILDMVAPAVKIITEAPVALVLHTVSVAFQMVVGLALDILTGPPDSVQELHFILQAIGGGLVEDVGNGNGLALDSGENSGFSGVQHFIQQSEFEFLALAVQLVDQLAGGGLQIHLRYDAVHVGFQHGQIGVGTVQNVFVADEKAEGTAVDDHHGAEAQLRQLESRAGAPDLVHVQFAVPLHHETMEEVVGQIVEVHIEFQNRGILMTLLDIHHGILLAEHGDKFVVGAVGEGEAELAHDAQNILDIAGIVPGGGQCAVNGGIVAGVFENPVNGAEGNQAVFGFLKPVEEDDVQGVGDPVGTEDHIILQSVIIFVPAAETDAQIVEPKQQIFLIAVHLTFPADILIIIAPDVVALHLFQPLLDLDPGTRPLGIQIAGFSDLVQQNIGKCFVEVFLIEFQSGESDDLGQAGIAGAEGALVHRCFGVLVDLVQHQQHGGTGGEALDVVEPVMSPVTLGVVPGVQEHHIHGPARQENAVHGVHDLLASEVPVVDPEGSIVHGVVPVFDDNAGGGGIHIVHRIAAAVHESGDGVGLARLAVAQEDHLDFVQGPGSACLAILEPPNYHFVRLLENAHIYVLNGGAC